MNNKYFACVLSLLVAHPTFAQSAEEGYIISSQTMLREVGSNLLIDLKLTLEKEAIRKMEKVTVTPILIGNTGELYTLEPFVLYGKKRQKIEIRKATLNKQLAPQKIKEYSYSDEIPFQLWMEEAKLVIDVSKTGCANCPAGHTEIQIPTLVELIPKVPYVMKPMPNFVMPDAEPIKNRAEVGNARIEFLSGKSVIMPEYRGNAVELAKINEAIKQVMTDTLAHVQSIRLTAYSSPEGSYLSNERLSKARAEALKIYVLNNNTLKEVPIQAQSVAEDWEMLRQMIVESEFVWKESALKVIDGTNVPDNREKGLKALGGGKPYLFMLKEWFPQLRRTNYQLNYSVKDFTVEQGRQIIRTRPGQMSLNEMFHVANSYEKGSPEFSEVFDIAIRLFPADPVANINAAAAAISQGDTIGAKRYLDKVSNDPRAMNNYAAYYMLTGEVDKAKEYLDKAVLQSEEVEHNSSEIQRKEENIFLLQKYRR